MIEIPVTSPSSLPRRDEDDLIGGEFVQAPENFLVEEIPAYLPAGEGEHLFVHIRKQDLNTKDVCDQWMDAFGLHPRDVGSAGLKDRNGTTTQWISFRGLTPAQIEAHPIDGVEVLACSLHRNKLKTGHLKGNHFTLTLTLDDEEMARGQRLCDVLRRHGMPNYYGKQRFGSGGRNRRDGAVLLRKAMAGEAKKSKGARRRFMVSSYQSGLFNDLLAHRINEGLLDTALHGDIMAKHDSGGQFSCEDVETEQARIDALAISPTGWMPGYKAAMAEGLPGEWEQALLDREEITAEDFRSLGKIAIGTRRPLRVPVSDLSLDRSVDDSAVAILSFSLPPGAYASMLLHALGVDFQ